MLDSDTTADPAAATAADPADTPAPRRTRARRPAKATAPAGAPKTSDVPDGADVPAAPAPKAAKAAAAPRIRISALAKELARPSKDVLAALTELGESGKTASSAIDETLAERVRALLVAEPSDTPVAAADESTPPTAPGVVFVAPGATDAGDAPAAPRQRRRKATAPSGPPPATDEQPEPAAAELPVTDADGQPEADPEDVREAAIGEANGARRRRRRGRRGRGGAKQQDDTDTESETDTETDGPDAATAGDSAEDASDAETAETAEATEGSDADGEDGGSGEGTGTRRRRRRRRSGGGSNGDASEDDPPNTVTHVREPAKKTTAKKKTGGGGGSDADDDGVRGVKGSTRLEARRQRRRDGRETSRRRPPILTEAEFLARREAVDRVMAVRQNGERTQIAVLEDDVLVEHYVTRARATSYVGNVYLGRVQNVLPSMEAAFIDIGKGRNGVLYAGEVNWDAAGLEGKSRAIENALKSGDSVLVQVTKDPFGHKGARLTSQISLPGRFLVYVPGGGMTGISRRLPDTERHRLKSILKKIVPEDAGVIVRTAAEGASEEELTRDVDRLKAEWETISAKAAQPKNAPSLVHGEPDLAIRVVRDVFNEDFARLVVSGDEAWNTVSEYVDGIAPELRERVSKHTGESDLFHDLRVDEGLAKALDRKVYLPSGGSLVIDRTEAMTVVDVNTGKFVGSGGNLEQTVTRNNLEAAEEIVRQLRLRDVGGIVVIDFIDMVLESNRDLVLRRLTECLGRDRTKHQVAEVTSLGLVQMTRKRVGEGLLEAFSETCDHCHGRGVLVHTEPIDQGGESDSEDEDKPAGKSRRRRGKKPDVVAEVTEPGPELSFEQREKALAAMNAIHRAAHAELEAASAADLELDAVESVLLGSAIDPELLDPSIEPEADAAIEPVEPAEPTGSTEAAVEAVSGLEAVSSEQTGPAAELVAPPEPEAEVEVVAVVEAKPEVEPEAEAAPQRPRPRRRRAASRPAGPPVGG